jgi:replication factor C large subunit
MIYYKMMWSEKYRPKKVEQMVGNEDARLAGIKWLANWVTGTKPLILVGPPGSGKTTFAKALARQFDYDLIEMNASDTRNKDALQARINPVLQNTGLFGKKIMLFLDEVDGISGREDSGGIEILVDLMREPTIPVIMAANRKSAKMKDLTKVSKLLEFYSIPQRLLLLFLDHVLQSEEVSLMPEERTSIINSSGGDVRSLLNVAQSYVAGHPVASNKDIMDIDIAEAINSYFSSPTSSPSSESLEPPMYFLAKADASYSDPRYEGTTPEARRKDMLAALFSSIVSSKVTLDDLSVMLNVLSRADMVVGRAVRMRKWNLLKYVTNMIATGLYQISRGKDIKYNQYAMPWPIMGPIFARSQSTRKIITELASATHTSKSICGSFILPYFIKILIDNKIDPFEFAIYNLWDESVGQSILKEIEKVKKK